jgi:sugar-specific transcriptional regulator TrmB
MNNIMTTPKDVLMSLGLTLTEAEIYICMMNNIRTAKEIIKYTNLKRPTVYYALTNLEHRGLISKKNNHLDHEYAVSSLDVLSGLAEKKRLESESLVEEVTRLIPNLNNKISEKDVKPNVAFYEGVETVKNIILSTAYCKSKQIKTIIPGEGFFWQVKDGHFLNEYIERRVKNGVKTQSLWEKRLDEKTFARFYKNISNIKILPSSMHGRFSTSIFIYDNKVMYISSLENTYCIIVTSAEHYEMMAALFEGIWAHAKQY